MSISEDVVAGISGVLAPAWVIRDGTVVPKTESIALRNGAVQVDATYAYADLAESSKLAQKINNEAAAKIIRAYLNAAVRIFRYYDGHIRSFDGDRVMAIFIGDHKNTHAVRAGLAINWAVDKVLKPQLAEKWDDLHKYWTVNHGVGIDTGEALLVRGGIGNNNDLVSVGAAPNVAAKLSSLRKLSDTYITKRVYDSMNDKNKRADDGQDMWKNQGWMSVGGSSYQVYGSTWWWSP